MDTLATLALSVDSKQDFKREKYKSEILKDSWSHSSAFSDQDAVYNVADHTKLIAYPYLYDMRREKKGKVAMMLNPSVADQTLLQATYNINT